MARAFAVTQGTGPPPERARRPRQANRGAPRLNALGGAADGTSIMTTGLPCQARVAPLGQLGRPIGMRDERALDTALDRSKPAQGVNSLSPALAA